MKKYGIFLMILVCLCLVCAGCSGTGASSGGVIQSANSVATVDSDGSCSVTITMQVQLEQTQWLRIPLPAEAREVRLNGSRALPWTGGDQMVLLLRRQAGTHTLELSFQLDSVITENGKVLQADIPLLTGVALPVERYTFTVTMPGNLTADPSFTSYLGDSTGDYLDVAVTGKTISGASVGRLNDSLDLTLEYWGDSDLFPDHRVKTPFLGGWITPMIVLMVLGALYYLVALFPSFPKKERCFNPPEGLAAGDIGTCITGCGMDLTMMVFSWAQMGYLSIEVDRPGRVLLRKRIEMGSERSDFEVKAFQKLFAGRQVVDGMGLNYALLYRKMEKKSPLLRQIYASRSGNPKILRILAMTAGGFCGILLSQGMYSAGIFTVLLAVVMGGACVGLSHLIQVATRALPLGNHRTLRNGIIAAVVWLILGWITGQPGLAAILVAYEALVGIATAVGGRRSEGGRQYLAQVRGLRAHLTRGSVFEIQQCLARNPNYFFEMMPYALALGVEKRFARRFGKVRIPACDYMVTGNGGRLTPVQWAVLMRQAADGMNRRQGRLYREKYPAVPGRK